MSSRVVLLFSLCLTFALLSIHATNRLDDQSALDAVRRSYHRALEDWLVATQNLDKADASTRIEKFKSARLAYKRVEWLAAYFDEGAIKRYINGAPLLSVEQHVAEVRVLTPTGFQPLEEQLYASPIDSAFAKTTHDLLIATAAVTRDLKRRSLTHGDVFAAARYGLIRIFTQGVTGYDTPASGNALMENYAALQSIEHLVTPLLINQHDLKPRVRDSISITFSQGLSALSDSNFDDFDRLEFLKNSIDPLYRMLLDVHLISGADLPSEKQDRAQAHNYRSESIFADDFLNDYAFANQPAEDSLFLRKQQLGKELFYDVNLSADSKLSCASCHNPTRAFTDGQAKSLGNDGAPLARNAPTLVGAVFAERYFTDMREPTLARQIRHVVQDEHEFGTDYFAILANLRAATAYAAQFAQAYADVAEPYQISTYSLSDALVAYVRGLHANASPVDAYIRGERASLAENVKRGFNLFTGKAVCATCHFAPTWAGLVPPFYQESESEVLGVPQQWPITSATTIDTDMGRAGSGRPLDATEFYVASFKTPTVRNAALTAPYMHNGSIDSLSQIVTFYNSGGGTGLGFDVPHQTLPFDSLSLNAREQADLVAFMEALTDNVSWE